MRSLMLAAMALLLAARIEAATVLVFSDPKGATVKVGDVEKKTPVRITLPEGTHVLTFSKDGYETHEETVEVGKKLIQLSIKLEKPRYPVDVIFKDISEAGWYVFADGKLCTVDGCVMKAPATVKLPLGKTKITIMKDGFQDQTKEVEIKEDGVVVEFDDLKAGASSLTRLTWICYVGAWVKNSGTTMVVHPDLSYTMYPFEKWRGVGHGKLQLVKGILLFKGARKTLKFKYDEKHDMLFCIGESDWHLTRKKPAK